MNIGWLRAKNEQQNAELRLVFSRAISCRRRKDRGAFVGNVLGQDFGSGFHG
ncbi:hypothetical protein [Bradyrhizobium sp. STM 3562]|uniref:hypothetical protein n=1 Tax=Bradyrhizobium sp. STM 3562 TaxID=578924 RepID=UPI00388F6E8D